MRLGIVLAMLYCCVILSSCGPNAGAAIGGGCSLSTDSAGAFKTEQLKNTKVAGAYKEKCGKLSKLLADKGIKPGQMQLFLRAFKAEGKLEVWAKNKADSTFALLTEYTICKKSGKAGPKRKEGDKQVPEGFYHITMFNPNSKFYLSLGLNYPNQSDRILGDPVAPGFDIFIHGDCVTVGCLPLTDDIIKELYILAIEAKDGGQAEIPVHIFPSKDMAGMGKPNNPLSNGEHAVFWANLKPGFDYFEKHHKLPAITVDAAGRYVVKP